ncbi:MAG: helix-turn-helix domain-containing protein [Armatimonadetes bacterium]|nr:helix-turn-helix domain-containing protein [Armatimonadota bacterium]
MDPQKRKRLEAAGWKSVTVAEFLGLSREEEAVVEIHAALAQLLREVRAKEELSQAQIAEKIGTGQARISKMENGAPGTSTDRLIMALIAAGATPQRIGEAIAGITLTVPDERPEDARPEEELTATG